MNAPFDPSDLHFSVAWPEPETFSIPAHVAAVLDDAVQRLMRPAASARSQALLQSAYERIVVDLDKLTAPMVRVHMIGNVGNGKTTALCVLTNLTRSDASAERHRGQRIGAQIKAAQNKLDKLAKKAAGDGLDHADKIAANLARSRLQQLERALHQPIGPADADRLLLPASGGRTTLCPMALQYAAAPAIEIVPMPPDDLRLLIDDFAAGLIAEKLRQKGDPPEEHVSEETGRALRNMAGLTNAALKDLVKFAPSAEALTQDILLRMRLPLRRQVRFEPAETADAGDWLAETLSAINYGKATFAPYPARVEIFWPAAPRGLHLIDTRGLDAHVTEDVRRRLEDDASVAVLCSSFTGVPDAMTIAALRHAKVMGRRHGIVILGLARQESDYSGNIADDEDPCDRKINETQNRLAQERLPVPPVVAGAVQVHGSLMVDAISQAVTDLRASWRADLERHAATLAELLKDGHVAILDELTRYQEAHIHTVATAAIVPKLPKAARLFVFDELPHASTLAACIRRRGVYENLNAAHVATNEFRAAVGEATDTLEALLIQSARAARPTKRNPTQTAAYGIVCDRIDAFQQGVRTAVSEKLIDLVVQALADHPADGLFDLCGSAWGPGSRDIRGSEPYRLFVIRHLDRWMTDDMELASMLAAHALRIWQTEIDRAVRHADAYATTAS